MRGNDMTRTARSSPRGHAYPRKECVGARVHQRPSKVTEFLRAWVSHQ